MVCLYRNILGVVGMLLTPLCHFAFSIHIKHESVTIAVNDSLIWKSDNKSDNLLITFKEMQKEQSEMSNQQKKLRVKRQQSSGAGKFTEAANMPQMKVFRLILQLFKNLWASSYVGGSNPLHPDVPKPVVYLFKDTIVNFFFPEVGEEHVKKSH